MKRTPTPPTTVAEVLYRAAQLIRTNGLHHGDYVADPFNRNMDTPHCERPMDVVGALFCAVSGDPRVPSNLAWHAIGIIGRRVVVNGQPAWGTSIDDLERHLHAWSDEHDAEHVTTWLSSMGRLLNTRLAVAA